MNDNDSKLKIITNKAQEMKALETEIDVLEQLLKTKMEALEQISGVDLPEMMAEIGLSQFSLTDGTKFKVTPVLKVSIPKANMEKANKWLVDHNDDGMVKTALNLPRAVPDYAIKEIIAFIKKQGFFAEMERKIHPQTLWKWGRETELDGRVIPEDIFNVYRSSKTVIER